MEERRLVKDTVRFELLSTNITNKYASLIAKETVIAAFALNNPYNWIIPKPNDRVEIYKIRSNNFLTQMPCHSHILFGDNSNDIIIGHSQLIHTKDVNIPKCILTKARQSHQSIYLFTKHILFVIFEALKMAFKIDVLFPYRSHCFTKAKLLIFEIFEARFTNDYWYIGFFCINPQFQRKGYGSKMLCFAIEKIKQYQLKQDDGRDEKELVPIMLWTFNPLAIKLYTKHGFTIFAQVNIDRSSHKLYGLCYEYDNQDYDDKIIIDLCWADLFPDIEMDKYSFILTLIILLLFPLIIICVIIIVVLRLLNINKLRNYL